jgi:hypothetical protein
VDAWLWPPTSAALQATAVGPEKDPEEMRATVATSLVRTAHLVAVHPTCSWKAALELPLQDSRQTRLQTRISGSSQFPISHINMQRSTEGIA